MKHSYEYENAHHEINLASMLESFLFLFSK